MNNFPGQGKRRPLIDLPIDQILLDKLNPRLAKQRESISQLDLLKTLFIEYDLEDLALSMSKNGYFDEEPIIVVSESGINTVNWDSMRTDEIQDELKKVVFSNSHKFIVVEGNRRVATAQLLANPTLRKQLGIKEHQFPIITDTEILDDIKAIPAIVYNERKYVKPYLGVKHITGLLKWDAFAKAAYIAQSIDDEEYADTPINKRVENIQQQIADRSDVIKKQYICYKLLKEAESKFDIDTKKIKQKFSLITVALNSPSIRKYLGVPSYRDVDLNKDIVPDEKGEELENVLTWIYGNEKKSPVLTDSRSIQKELSAVLSSRDATEYLIKSNNLEEAYERTNGEKEFLVKKINSSTRSLQSIMGFVWKYVDDPEINDSINECRDTIDAIIKLKQ